MSQGKLATSLFAVVPALLAACVEVPGQGDELDVGTESQELGGCSSWGCNSNSPVIDAWDFHELEELGLPNSKGVRLLRLVQGGIAYRVDVAGSRIYARSASHPTLSGTQLINSYMEVNTPGGVYRIYIKNVSQVVKYWVGSPSIVETYDLVYTNQPAMTDLRPLCKDAPGRLDGEGQWWLKPLEAIVFTGDRYDADSLEVTTVGYSASGNWFNIGCAGGALAKLHLNRHTTASSDSTHQTDWAMRQTMLKMYTADVCGSGDASTKQGEPLHWENVPGWQTLTGAEASYEALWDEGGMICMDHHRLEGSALWPTMQSAIISVCGSLPPTCASMFPGGVTSFPDGYLLTANP